MRNLASLNRALLCKWSWWYSEERGAFWQKVTNKKYGEDEGGWCSREVRDGMGLVYGKPFERIGILCVVGLHFKREMGGE